MDEAQSIKLIIEAVRYCQRVRTMGMPPACYSKALREPIYFLWECRAGGAKTKNIRYRSRATIGLRPGDGQLVRDHAIPFRYLQSELLALGDIKQDVIRKLLAKYDIAVLITKSENDLLNRNGLQAKMPPDWNGVDPLARYRSVGIELVESESAADS